MNNTVIHVVVEAKSKFGILNKTDGKWLNTKDADLLKAFRIGSEYDVEMVESKGKDGKTYLNIATIIPVTSNGTPTPKPDAKPFVKSSPVVDNKDNRILFQGLTQAVLQSPVMTYAKKGEEVAYVESLVVALAAMVKKLAA